MDNDSGALILLIVLIVSAFLLFVIKLAQFVNRFNREKQCLLTEMNRAAESKSSGPQGPLLFCACEKNRAGCSSGRRDRGRPLLHIGHHAQDHQRLRAGVDHAVAVTGGAVVGHAGADGDGGAVIGAHALPGEKVHHLKAALVDMVADGAACGQGQDQNLSLLVLKFAHQGLPLTVLEMGNRNFGNGGKIQKHGVYSFVVFSTSIAESGPFGNGCAGKGAEKR